MQQFYDSKIMLGLWKLGVGFVGVVLILGAGATLAQAEKGPDHSDLRSDHGNLAIDHDGLSEKLNEVLESINNLVVGPLCGAGTEGQRFVVSADGKEVCDNTTGRYWEQAPNPGNGVFHATAILSCANLDLGNGQSYRLPEIKELISLVDYSQMAPALPAGHPFSNILLGTRYWSKTVDARDSTRFWYMDTRTGSIPVCGETCTFKYWCVR